MPRSTFRPITLPRGCGTRCRLISRASRGNERARPGRCGANRSINPGYARGTFQNTHIDRVVQQTRRRLVSFCKSERKLRLKYEFTFRRGGSGKFRIVAGRICIGASGVMFRDILQMSCRFLSERRSIFEPRRSYF